MKIKTKIALPIILVAFIILSAISLYSYLFTTKILKDEISRNLEMTAELTERYIKSILDEQKDKIELVATHGELSREELLEISDISLQFYEVFVMNSEGIVINSTDPQRIGLDRSDDTYFTNAREASYIKPAYFSEDTQKNAIAVSAPHAGGVVVARIELEYFNAVVSDRIGLGKTGESLLGYKDREGKPVFFTERRFKEEAEKGHEEEHHVLPIEQALANNEDVFFEFDYRHVPTIAATRYIEEAQIGIVTKIDQAEALASSRSILIFSVVSVMIALVVFLIIAFWLAKRISGPIIALGKATEIIRKGNLDYKIDIKNKDEIGGLAVSFGQMTKSLKESQENIEAKIAERTEALEKVNKFMVGRELKMVELKKEIAALKASLAKGEKN